MDIKKIVITIILFFFIVNVYSQRPPKWSKKLPKAKNSTYYYMNVEAEGNSRDVAVAYAEILAVKQMKDAFLSLTKIEEDSKLELDTQKSGDATIKRDISVDGGISEFALPKKLVCKKVIKNKAGRYVCYLLYQVAKDARIQVQYSDFKCK